MKLMNFMELQKEVEKHYDGEFASEEFLIDCAYWLNKRPECLNKNVNIFGLLKEFLEELNKRL